MEPNNGFHDPRNQKVKTKVIVSKISARIPQKSYDIDKENWIKILKLFFDGPKTTLHIREVARRTKITPQGLNLYSIHWYVKGFSIMSRIKSLATTGEIIKTKSSWGLKDH